MGGHSSKGMTFQEPAGVTPPPTPSFIVTGDGDPNPNGNYYESELYDGVMSYKHESLNYWIWRMSVLDGWFLSTELGEAEDIPAWIQDVVLATPLGMYRDYNYSEGELMVSLP